MKIGEARTIYSDYYNKLGNRYAELKKQMEREKALGDDVRAGVTLELSEAVLKKREEVAQFARFDIPELIYNMENAAMEPERAEAAQEYAEDIAKILEVARRIASGAKVPPEDEKKLMEFNADLYRAVKAAAQLAIMREKEEYDSLWQDEEKKEPTPAEEIEKAVLESELSMEMPEIDMSLLEG